MKDDHHLILYLILSLIYREKTVYLKTHKMAINGAVDYTGWRSRLPAWKGWKLQSSRIIVRQTDNINLPSKIQDLKYPSKHVMMRRRKNKQKRK